MKKTETIVDFGSGDWGEDRLCLLENMYCVLDGATPIKRTTFAGYHSSAEWMADCLAEHIKKEPDYLQPYPLMCKSFVDAVETVRNTFENVHDLPCLTTAALQCRDRQLQCWVLGDCSIYLLMKDGELCRITDTRVAHFSEKTVQVKTAAINRGEDPATAVLEQRIRNKAMMNQLGGYWTVGFNGDFANEFVECTVEADQVQAVLLCTDGLDRLFTHYGVAPQEVLSEEMPLKDAVCLLREKERNEKNANVKKHDDVAAILLKI